MVVGVDVGRFGDELLDDGEDVGRARLADKIRCLGSSREGCNFGNMVPNVEVSDVDRLRWLAF